MSNDLIIKNSLTDDELDQIKDLENTIKMLKKAKALCNHRTIDGSGDSLTFNPVDYKATCKICGATFTPRDPDYMQVAEDAENVINVLQTIKVMWPDMPRNEAEKLYSAIPMLEELEATFKHAAEIMKKRNTSYAVQDNNPFDTTESSKSFKELIAEMYRQ